MCRDIVDELRGAEWEIKRLRDAMELALRQIREGHATDWAVDTLRTALGR